MPANKALSLNINQIGNVGPDIPPSQNNCLEQKEQSDSTTHYFVGDWGRERDPNTASPGGEQSIVELEHLQNWEIPRFTRSTRPEGSLYVNAGRQSGLCCGARGCVCMYALYHAEPEHYRELPSLMINTSNSLCAQDELLHYLSEPVTSSHLTNGLLRRGPVPGNQM